jgi:hypothetical protein
MDIEDESSLPVITIGKALSFKDNIEDELINFFIVNPLFLHGTCTTV